MTFMRAVGGARLLRVCAVLLGALLLLWLLPPRRAHARRVADDLAARAACPRPGPQVFSDSAAGLSAVQRCGVIWAALEALPPAGQAYLKAHAADYEHVMVLGLSDVVAIRTRYGDLPYEPRQPWLDRQRIASAWVLTVAISAREYVGVHQIWVDKRTGVARRVVTGGTQGRRLAGGNMR